MGHNNVVSGHPKSTGILLVDRLSMGPSDFRRHGLVSEPKYMSTEG